MIIARAPLRVGLVGGGSDLPEFFATSPGGGAVLGIALAKHVYVTLLPLADIAPERIRFTYRVTESVQAADDLKHPVVRAVLSEMPELDRLNLGTMADMPGESGLGSSSSFTVALLHALLSSQGHDPGPETLAKLAIRMEREVLGEAGGWQDQLQAAFGGIRLYEFDGSGFQVSDPLDADHAATVAQHLALIYDGSTRRSHESQLALKERIYSGSATSALEALSALARTTWQHLRDTRDPSKLARILASAIDESSRLKAASLGHSWKPSPSSLPYLARKPLGADGGGFSLIVMPAGREGTHSDLGATTGTFPVVVDGTGSTVTRFGGADTVTPVR